ncbi:MAG TPA: outer membrane protein assembly factor BamE [Ramlibacter sp.]|nr:outer membrane protein assembly factor BamE [Ramlibacter sp.]
MPAISPRLSRLAFVLAVCAAAAGCGSLNSASQRIAGAVTPYKPQTVQGNFVSREQVEALRPGMSRNQARDILGTALVTSLFHADRWDYVFTLRRQDIAPQAHRLTLYFKGDMLERFEGDPMPSEAEFVSLLDFKRSNEKTPALEATAAQLERFPPPPPAAPAPAEPPPANYPPLEAPVTR